MPERSAHGPVGGPVAGTPGDRVPLSNPAIDPEGLAWTRVSPKHLSVVVLSTLLSTLFWLAALGWPAVLAATGVWSGAPLGLLLLPPAAVLAAGLLSVLLAPRRVRAIGYAEREQDLLVRKGVLFRTLVVVPYGRMQFVDVQAGPLDRLLGIARVQLHTASALTDAAIPGLPLPEAERLRDRLASRGEATLAGL